jgi:hypothetical protein
VTTHWGNLTETIWVIDRKAEILTWHESTNAKPLTESSEAITTKDQLGKYVANVYMEQAKNMWLRFQIAHDVDKAKFQNDAFNEVHIQVSYDKIQAKRTAIWGWMLGAISETANVNDMKEACENHP